MGEGLCKCAPRSLEKGTVLWQAPPATCNAKVALEPKLLVISFQQTGQKLLFPWVWFVVFLYSKVMEISYSNLIRKLDFNVFTYA